MQRQEEIREQDVPKTEDLQASTAWVEAFGARAIDRTSGWGGKSLAELSKEHRRLRLGDFHAEAEVAYAEMAEMQRREAVEQLQRMREELDRLSEEGVDEHAVLKKPEARKREAEAELSVIPPEAHMTDYDVALKKGYTAALNRLSHHKREKRANKDPETAAMRQEVKRLKEEYEQRQCEKTLMVAAALKLPPAENLLKEGKQINDIVHQHDESGEMLEPWRILYATDIRSSGTGYNAILRREGDGKMKLVNISELLSPRFMTDEQLQTLKYPPRAKALPSGDSESERALVRRSLSGPLGERTEGPTSLVLRREVTSPVTIRSRLRTWWKSLWS